MAKLQIRYGQHTLAGAKAENQDALACSVPDNPAMLEHKGIVCAIADGISRSEQAREASHAAVSGFVADYFSTPDSWSVKQAGGKVLTAINVWLCGQNQAFRDNIRGLATTFSAVVLKSATAHCFHVGDARIYLLRDGELEQLTTDHRIRISEETEYLGRALGVDYALDIDYKSLALQRGDRFVLVTDGVYEFLSDHTLKTLLEKSEQPDAAAAEICELSLKNGSRDNLSCQLLIVDDFPEPQADEVFAQLTALPFPPDLQEGMVLDGCRVVREIHASSTSQLYQAVDIDTGQAVVIKTPSVNFEDDPAYLERFQLEEWIGRRIDNPHVVRTIEPVRGRQWLYYLLEYIEGSTLEQILDDNGPLELHTVRQLVPQIISGLRAFHRLDMLHQDIKPGNVLVTEAGSAKIIDFGSTKIAGIADIATPIERKALLGTKQFTAPEYLLGENGSTCSDQFSLGVMIYQLLSGRLPYGDSYARVQGQKQLDRLQYTPLRVYRDDIPYWVDRAIRRAVEINPARRYQKLSELEADLNKPNPAFLREEQAPLIERHPLAFWRGLALLLLIGHFIWLMLWFQAL